MTDKELKKVLEWAQKKSFTWHDLQQQFEFDDKKMIQVQKILRSNMPQRDNLVDHPGVSGEDLSIFIVTSKGISMLNSFKNQKDWYEKPIGIIILALVATLIGGYLIIWSSSNDVVSRPFIYVKHQDGILDVENKKVEFVFTLVNNGNSTGKITSEEFGPANDLFLDKQVRTYDPKEEHLSIFKNITYGSLALPLNLIYRIKYIDINNESKKFCKEYHYEFVESENGKLNRLSDSDCNY